MFVDLNAAPVEDGGACGTIDAPCPSVTAALAAKATFVVIASGTYVESVVAPSTPPSVSVFLCGAYTPDAGAWARGDASTIIAGGASNITIADRGGPSCLVIDGVDVRSRTAGPGESLYGIVSISTNAPSQTLCLRSVVVSVAAGGDGLEGGVGAPAQSGACDAGGDGAPGNNGDAGAAASEGSFQNGEYIPANGTAGSTGSSGASGTFSPRSCSSGRCEKNAGNCQWDNQGGCLDDAGVACDPGFPACGGGGGGGGAGGGGGGASVGIVALRSIVIISNAHVTAAHGGAGGVGGSPAPGGDASAANPGDCSDCECLDTVNGCPPTSCSIGNSTINPGVHGAGGSGGAGGAGGGGAGGWSCGFLLGSDPSGVLDASTINVGEAGAGAEGAANGQAFRVCFVDGGGVP